MADDFKEYKNEALNDEQVSFHFCFDPLITIDWNGWAHD